MASCKLKLWSMNGLTSRHVQKCFLVGAYKGLICEDLSTALLCAPNAQHLDSASQTAHRVSCVGGWHDTSKPKFPAPNPAQSDVHLRIHVV
eukprot:1400081-Amphidinium_carterae.3